MNVWKNDVVAALQSLGRPSKLTEIYQEVRTVRLKRAALLPKSTEDIVRRTLQQFSSNTASYTGKEDLFESIDGLGKGVWGLRYNSYTREFLDNEVDLEIPEDLTDISIESLRSKAYLAVPEAGKKNTKIIITRVNERRAIIKAYALKRAKGICECCGSPSPFIDLRGQPFLEVHHIKKLSDNGLDSPKNVAAITPNCHKRIHHGEDGADIDKKLADVILEKEKTFIF